MASIGSVVLCGIKFQAHAVDARGAVQQLVDDGVKILAPPLWMLVRVNDAGVIEPSVYARAAKAVGARAAHRLVIGDEQIVEPDERRAIGGGHSD